MLRGNLSRHLRSCVPRADDEDSVASFGSTMSRRDSLSSCHGVIEGVPQAESSSTIGHPVGTSTKVSPAIISEATRAVIEHHQSYTLGSLCKLLADFFPAIPSSAREILVVAAAAGAERAAKLHYVWLDNFQSPDEEKRRFAAGAASTLSYWCLGLGMDGLRSSLGNRDQPGAAQFDTPRQAARIETTARRGRSDPGLGDRIRSVFDDRELPVPVPDNRSRVQSTHDLLARAMFEAGVQPEDAAGSAEVDMEVSDELADADALVEQSRAHEADRGTGRCQVEQYVPVGGAITAADATVIYNPTPIDVVESVPVSVSVDTTNTAATSSGTDLGSGLESNGSLGAGAMELIRAAALAAMASMNVEMAKSSDQVPMQVPAQLTSANSDGTAELVIDIMEADQQSVTVTGLDAPSTSGSADVVAVTETPTSGSADVVAVAKTTTGDVPKSSSSTVVSIKSALKDSGRSTGGASSTTVSSGSKLVPSSSSKNGRSDDKKSSAASRDDRKSSSSSRDDNRSSSDNREGKKTSGDSRGEQASSSSKSGADRSSGSRGKEPASGSQHSSSKGKEPASSSSSGKGRELLKRRAEQESTPSTSKGHEQSAKKTVTDGLKTGEKTRKSSSSDPPLEIVPSTSDLDDDMSLLERAKRMKSTVQQAPRAPRPEDDTRRRDDRTDRSRSREGRERSSTPSCLLSIPLADRNAVKQLLESRKRYFKR